MSQPLVVDTPLDAVAAPDPAPRSVEPKVYTYRRYRFVTDSVPVDFVNDDRLRYFVTVLDADKMYHIYSEFTARVPMSYLKDLGFNKIMGLNYVSRRTVLEDLLRLGAPEYHGRPSRVDHYRKKPSKRPRTQLTRS